MDYSKLKRDNSGFTFILSITDCFSRLAFAIPIKRKTGKEVAAALRRAFDHISNLKKLYTDQGKEFYNRYVKELFRNMVCTTFLLFKMLKLR